MGMLHGGDDIAKHAFQGVLFDCLEEIVIDRAPVLRATYAEAMEDARKMVAFTNEQAERFDDEQDSDSTIGRVDDSYCYVLIDGVISYGETEAA